MNLLIGFWVPKWVELPGAAQTGKNIGAKVCVAVGAKTWGEKTVADECTVNLFT